MFRLDNFLEAWAQKYRPLSHDPSAKSKHRTFYRIDRLGDSNEFVRNFNTAPSPCMAVPTNIDGGMGKNNKQLQYHHGLYFMVKQPTVGLSKTALQDDVIFLEGKRDTVICQAAIQYTDGFTESLFSYVNNINTPEGGTHETGFKAAFTKDTIHPLLF